MLGLLIILIAVFVSIFGYLIAPDASPNADLQTVEIQAKKPGYSQLFLKIPDKNNTEASWLAKLLSGKRNDFRFIPTA